ncbi:MAG: hypothetical protein NUV50_06800 [Rhodospirillales bacterium]|nr:hypothetical protein [Rhodospirillales bacterium]
MRKLKLSILSDAILYKMYLHAAEHGGRLIEVEITNLFSVKITTTFFKSAIKRLEDAELVHIQYPLEQANRYEITGMGIDYVQSQLDVPHSTVSALKQYGDEWLDEDEQNNHVPEARSTDDEADSWSPLPLERSGRAYESAVETTETAFDVIKGNNGYAESEPEERSLIVWSIGETLKQIKEGLPTKDQVMAGLVKPLKYISEKFTGAAMGEAAKAAVKALFDWIMS